MNGCLSIIKGNGTVRAIGSDRMNLLPLADWNRLEFHASLDIDDMNESLIVSTEDLRMSDRVGC